jgi:2-keto-4-pentenoate hydratase/2-oxohepta-3-ene-1,7-dioic acid hydratase in catechol pathway
VYGNYQAVEQVEGASVAKHPRFLNGPASALSRSPAEVEVPPRARTLQAGVELAFVVGRVACQVSVAEADRYILGYLSVASLCDRSFGEDFHKIVDDHDWGLPEVYGRWADGFSVVSEAPRMLAANEVRGRPMILRLDGLGEARGNTDEYVHLAPETLAFITQAITLFPGDVVTLGRVAERLTIAADRPVPAGTSGEANVEGVGSARFVLKDRRRSVHGGKSAGGTA